VPPSRATAACLLVALTGGLLAGDLKAASPKERLKAKQAEARTVVSQVNALDRRFEASVEAWNGAKYELAQTRVELRRERATLKNAQRQRALAIARVEARVVALYESDDDTSTLGIVLGSSTLSDLLDRLEAAHAVASFDHRLAVEATAARNRVAAAAARTARLERARAGTVARLDSERTRIGALLSQRRRLLASVQSQVTKLQAEEARRQAELAAAARARLARRQALLRREAAAKAAAAAAKAEAERKAAAQARTPPPTTTAATTTTATTTAPAVSDAPPPATTTAPLPTTDPATTTTAAPPAPAPAASLPAGHPEAASIAMRYLGAPYAWGGATPAGFDCSGLVMYVYAQIGIALPHYAAAQFGLGVPVPRADLQPGDLVFFDALNHVGIYIGGGEMVHAPQTGDVVKITPLSEFAGRYVGARRL
jgi:peptidoglycan DL-endopeptidase CwlO